MEGERQADLRAPPHRNDHPSEIHAQSIHVPPLTFLDRRRFIGGLVRRLHVFKKRLPDVDRRTDQLHLLQVALGQTGQGENYKSGPHRDRATQRVGRREQFDVTEFHLVSDHAQLVGHRAEGNVPQGRVDLQTDRGQAARQSIGPHLHLDQVERFDDQGPAGLARRRKLTLLHETLEPLTGNQPARIDPDPRHPPLLQTGHREIQLGEPRTHDRQASRGIVAGEIEIIDP